MLGSMEETIPFDNEILSDDEPVWSCPYCGDEDGEPISVYSREFQGCAEHGGMVEWEEKMCTICEREERMRQMKLAAEGY